MNPQKPWPRYAAAVLGFRNYWYPVLLSSQIRRLPVFLTMLGEELAFFRRDGKVYCLEGRCAHRGVPLTVGRCDFPGTISCRYHGWTYDLASGELIAAITDGPDSPLVGKVRLRTYPVEERKGVVWAYIGDGAAPPLEKDVPEEVLAEGTAVEGRVRVRRGNWRLAAENGFDPAHATYLHRDAWLSLFRQMPASKGRITPEIVDGWVGYTQDRIVAADYPGLGRYPKARWWKRGRGGAKTQLRLPACLRVNPFPAPGIVHFEWYVPVDGRHHRYFQFAVKEATGLKSLWFRMAYRLWWKWLAHVQFNNQDAWMVELMEPFYSDLGGWDKERLFRPDVGLTAWRVYAHENGREVQRVAGVESQGTGMDRDAVALLTAER